MFSKLLKVGSVTILLLALFLGYRISNADAPTCTVENEKMPKKAFTAVFQIIHSITFTLESIGLISRIGILRVAPTPFRRSLSRQRLTDDVVIFNDRFADVDVTVFRYRDMPEKLSYPTIVYVHGGGWSLYSPKEYAQFIHDVALDTKTQIVAVDYRLAPEHPHPAQLNDCKAVAEYLIDNPAVLNIDSKRLLLMGDSAGAHLATATAYQLRHRRGAIAAQVLICPPLQMVNFQLASYHIEPNVWYILGPLYLSSFAGVVDRLDSSLWQAIVQSRHISPDDWHHISLRLSSDLLPREFIPKSYKDPFYLTQCDAVPQSLTKLVLDKNVFPLLADNDDLRRMPKTYISVGERDALRDEGIIYGTRLKENSVPVDVNVVEKAAHNFPVLYKLGFANYSAGYNDTIRWISEFLSQPLPTDQSEDQLPKFEVVGENIVDSSNVN